MDGRSIALDKGAADAGASILRRIHEVAVRSLHKNNQRRGVMINNSTEGAGDMRPGGKHNTSDGDFDLQSRVERLMPDLRIAIVFGGDKSVPGSVVYQSTNTRSWKSYESVAQDIAASLRRVGFRHVDVLPEDMNLGDRLRRGRFHMAWLNSGGVQGYNSAAHAAGLLESIGVPYVGHDPLTATTLDNKHAFKREAQCAGFSTAPFFAWDMARGPLRPDLNSRFHRAFADFRGPFVVKPVSGRASLHVDVVADRASLPAAVERIYRATENLVLVEKYLPGREFCIAVAGPVTARDRKLTRGAHPFAFAALERILAADEKIFTSMDVRPITDERFRVLDSTRDAQVLEKLRQIAREVYLEFSLNSIVRIDLRCDEGGALHILEANPKPDLKHPAQGVTSLICGGLADEGMDYDDLILSLLADRLDFLFRHRRGAVGHIAELLTTEPTRTGQQAIGTVAAMIDRIAVDLHARAPEPASTAVAAEAVHDIRPEAGRRQLTSKKARAG
jgi:D-alanine-D-alanine ligase